MKNGATYFKYTVILVIFLLVLWFLRDLRCNGNGNGVRKPDTIKVVRDTVIHHYEKDTQYVPKPYRVTTTEPNDTIYLEREPIGFNYDSLPQSVKDRLADYSSKKYYLDSFTMEHGKLYLYDTVRYNRITGKGFGYVMNIPEITNTITLREPPRVKGFIGLGISGNIQTPLAQAEVSFGLLTKKEQYWGVKSVLRRDGGVLYGVEAKRLIRLRKK